MGYLVVNPLAALVGSVMGYKAKEKTKKVPLPHLSPTCTSCICITLSKEDQLRASAPELVWHLTSCYTVEHVCMNSYID